MNDDFKYIDLDADGLGGWETFRAADVGLEGALATDLPGRIRYLRKYTDGTLASKPDTRVSVALVDGEASEEFEHEFPHDEIWLMLAGTGYVVPERGDRVELQANRLVWLPKGMRCHWRYTSDYLGIFIHLW